MVRGATTRAESEQSLRTVAAKRLKVERTPSIGKKLFENQKKK